MSKKWKSFVILNPHAGGGKARRLWPKVSESLRRELGSFDFEESTSIGHAQVIAAEAVAAGYNQIIACGGDGTIHEVVNGIFESKSSPSSGRPILGILSMGTGGDLVRTLKIPKKISAQIKTVAGSKTQAIDLGRVHYTTPEGKTESCLFINITSAGLSAEVVRRMPRFRNIFGRRIAYLAATLDAYRHWKPTSVKISTDKPKSNHWPETPVCIAIANGQYFGGGMPIANRADPSDGSFDLVTVAPISVRHIPKALALLYSKNFHKMPEVRQARVRQVTLTSEGPVGLDIDGEPIGSLPAKFEILPKALEIKVP